MSAHTPVNPGSSDEPWVNWMTVAMIGLPPGWKNVYCTVGASQAHTSVCPAILLQERRYNGPGLYSGTADLLDPPYQTRTVFAAYNGDWIGPAAALSNYVETVEPDMSPDVLLPKSESD